jgi:hypothetical protein
MAKPFDVGRFNKILNEHKQQLQAKKITGKQIVLSNGLVINCVRDVGRCKRRVMTGDNVWKENFDRLYSLDKQQRDIAEKECRSLTSANGGMSCQRKHGEKIKSNLNTGVPWNKGLKGNYPYSYPRTEETKEKIGNANRGDKNGMFGKKHSTEYKDEQSKKMKEKILSGEFTPNSNNRNTHWDSFYKNKKYRSSWEALYQYFDNAAEYEVLRISYSFNDKNYIYIVDFVNHETNTVVEVKPKELVNDKKTQAKILAAQNWCINNKYTFVLADKEFFTSKKFPTDLTEFDVNTQQKIRKLYEVSQQKRN